MNEQRAAQIVTVAMIWTGLMVFLGQGWGGGVISFIKDRIGATPKPIVKAKHPTATPTPAPESPSHSATPTPDPNTRGGYY